MPLWESKAVKLSVRFISIISMILITNCLLIIYPKLFPSGFRKLIEKIPEIFPTPQVEIKSDQNQ